MREMKFGLVQTPLQVDLDKIADSIVEALGADIALVNVLHKREFISLGLSSGVMRMRHQRIHTPQDLACLQTVQSDKPFVLNDAQAHPIVRDTPHVKQGIVKGYLGVPLQNAEIGPIGSICAVTSQPRDWTEADQKYLEGMALTVESLLLREMYRLESANASDLILEYDSIISAFATVRAEPTSIHDAEGRLLFANRALTDHVSEAELESGRFLALMMQRKTDQPLRFQAKSKRSFVLNFTETSCGYVVFQWAEEVRRLN